MFAVEWFLVAAPRQVLKSIRRQGNRMLPRILANFSVWPVLKLSVRWARMDVNTVSVTELCMLGRLRRRKKNRCIGAGRGKDRDYCLAGCGTIA